MDGDIPDTREVADNLDAKLAQELAVADTRALKDLGRAESTGGDDDHLAGLHHGLVELTTVCAVAGWDVSDTNGLVVVVEQDAVNASVGAEVEVALHIHDRVDVCCTTTRQRWM